MMKRITVFLAFFSLLLGIIIINSCKKDVVIPTLTTASVTDITINSATAGGSITKDGGATVTAREYAGVPLQTLLFQVHIHLIIQEPEVLQAI